jgi:Mor family transcriptional regulator
MTQDLYSLELNFPMEFADKLKASHKDGIDSATVSALKLWVGLSDDIREIITKQAKIEGMSRAEFVGKAVSKLMRPDLTYGDLFKGPGLAERRAARNKEIVERGLRGTPRAELALMFNLSEIRVHQIIAEGKLKLARDKILRNWTPDPWETT